MANKQFPYTPELEPFQFADDAWTLELRRLFGNRAGDVRYTPAARGEDGSKLRALYEARDAARRKWHASAD